MPDENPNDLLCAKRYYHDAPDECWKNPKVLELLRNGGWGKGRSSGGLMGCTFNGYTFAYKGLPLWDLLLDDNIHKT